MTAVQQINTNGICYLGFENLGVSNKNLLGNIIIIGVGGNAKRQ